MAKRKRLTPAPLGGGDPVPALETKAVNGWVGLRKRSPIADVAGDAAAQSAFEEVAGELRAARAEGRLVLSLPLSAVEAGHLVRDRLVAEPEEMAVLTDSLRARGQQTPIEVVDLGTGRYGLISGWRRLRALQALAVEDTARFGTVQALVRAPDTAAEAYRAMVEENEIRADLSFYERARIAVEAARQGIYADTKTAVQSLFSAARAPKRSKILSFTVLVEALDDHLRFPTAIPEKLGLPLVAALQERPGFKRQLVEALRRAEAPTVTAERAVLERALKPAASAAEPAPVAEEVAPGVALTPGKARLVLSGKGVDAALLADLRAWLQSRAP